MRRINCIFRLSCLIAVVFMAGCWPGANPAPKAKDPVNEGKDAETKGTWVDRTKFFKLCEGDRTAVALNPSFLGPNWTDENLLPHLLLGVNMEFGAFPGGWDVRAQQAITKRCDKAEDRDALLRNLYAELRKLASANGCQAEGPEELQQQPGQTKFQFSYEQDGRRGEVTGHVDPVPEAKEQGICTVKMSVKEGPKNAR